MLQSLKKEIERRIEVIPRIQYEPQLISDPRYILTPGGQAPPHYYRLKAVDDVKSLGKLLYYHVRLRALASIKYIGRVRDYKVRQLFEETSF